MANITPVGLGNAGSKPAFSASTPAGDAVDDVAGKTIIIEFQNGHSSSITVTIAPTQTTAVVDGVGTVTVPSRSLVLAAGEPGVFMFQDGQKAAYKDANGRFPISYTSGNAALTRRAFAI